MRTWILFISALPCLSISCQDTARGWPGVKQYPFILYEMNSIQNDSLLYPFYENLKTLELHPAQLTQFNILHIGDSHLQADFMTAVSRMGLQRRFGNVGRGCIVPQKLSKSNEPPDFWLRTSAPYRYERLLKTKKSFAVGPTGLGIRFDGTNPVIPIDIVLNQDSVLDYSFNRIRFLGKTHPDYTGELSIYNTANKLLLKTDFNPSKTYAWDERVNALYFDIENRYSKFIDLYGFVLSNRENGLLYHSIGINGARHIDYLNNDSLISQWKWFAPNLIILSLGTNEVIRGKFNRQENYLQMDSFFRELRHVFPGTPVLVCIPFDGYFGRARTNARIPVLKQDLIKLANLYRAAVWDAYRIGGGSGSAYYWKKHGLLTHDGVHFTRQGYAVQGDLLQRSLAGGFKKYSIH